MRYRLPFLLILLLAVLATSEALVRTASAQQPDTTVQDTAAVETRQKGEETADKEKKDPTRAVLYSLGGTVLLAPLYGAGLIVGPSFGHFYAEDRTQAWGGIGIRTGGLLFGWWGVSKAWEDSYETGQGIVIVGGLIVVGSAIYDIATANGSARQYNEAHDLAAQAKRTVLLAPTADLQSGQLGLALRVRL